MPWCHHWWITPPMKAAYLWVPVAPGCVCFGFSPSSLVITRAHGAEEMQWASMALHCTASML